MIAEDNLGLNFPTFFLELGKKIQNNFDQDIDQTDDRTGSAVMRLKWKGYFIVSEYIWMSTWYYRLAEP